MDPTLIRDGAYGGALLLLFIWWIRRTQAAQEKRDASYQKERDTFMTHLVAKDEVNTQIISKFTTVLDDMRVSMQQESKAVADAINQMAVSVSGLAKEIHGEQNAPEIIKLRAGKR